MGRLILIMLAGLCLAAPVYADDVPVLYGLRTITDSIGRLPYGGQFIYKIPTSVSNPIDASRRIDWTTAGAGTIPARSTVCFTEAATRTAAQINTDITNCGTGEVVYLDAGTFNNLGGQILINRDDVTVRGHGPQSSGGTKLHFSVGNDGACSNVTAYVCMKGGDGSDYSSVTGSATWTAGYTAGTTSITIGATTAGGSLTKPQVGRMIFLETYHDGYLRSQDTYPELFSCIGQPGCIQGGALNVNADRAPTQAARVVSITGDATCSANCTIVITPPLYINYRSDGSGGQKVYWPSYTNSAKGVGLEDLRIAIDVGAHPEWTCGAPDNDPNCTGGQLVGGTWIAESWVKGVQGDAKHSGRMVHFTQSQGLTFRSNYLFKLGTETNDTYGFNCYVCSGMLYENNIVQHVRSPFIHEKGNAGNVYVNNLTLNNFDPSLWHIFSFDPHGWAAMTLIEGNEGFSGALDNYFGPALMTTLFRNRFYLYDYDPSPTDQTALEIYGLTRHVNIIGNILGTTGYHTGYEQLATGNTTSSNSGDCIHKIYAIGLGSNCFDGDNMTWPYNDVHTADTLMRWGNCDSVTGFGSCVFTNGEVPSGLSKYANPIPATHNLPASMFYSARPNYWDSGIAYPAIGPDVSGGNIANSGGHAYRNPASECAHTMGLTTADTTPGDFTPATCYHPVP